MKKLLIIALLVVGCKNSTEPTNTCDDDVCEVKWLLMNYYDTDTSGGSIFWTGDKCDICFHDTTWLDEPYIDFTNSPNGIDNPDTIYYYIPNKMYMLDGDTLNHYENYIDAKVTSITHYKNPNYDNQLVSYDETGYFTINGEGEINPKDYIVFRFEYK